MAAKQVIAPDDHPSWAPLRIRIDNPTVKALARAFGWRRMLESGVYGTIDEVAKAEKINPSYMSRVPRLTLLAPEVTLPSLMNPFPEVWHHQMSTLVVET